MKLTQCKACLGNGGWCGECGSHDCNHDPSTQVECSACEGEGEIEDPNYDAGEAHDLAEEDYQEGVQEDAMCDLQFE